ncbi:MAG TPA: hypothetical protein VHW46_15675 [Terracidiphilus sp.]|nr:hypothetical protein [Terracidiphilus sp.]
MQLLNQYRGTISGKAQGLVALDEAADQTIAATEHGTVGERSGSRVHMDPSFRRITPVTSHQSSMRRGGVFNRGL